MVVNIASEQEIRQALALQENTPRVCLTPSVSKDLGLGRVEQLYFLGYRFPYCSAPPLIGSELRRPPTDPAIITRRQVLVQTLMDDRDTLASLDGLAALTDSIGAESYTQETERDKAFLLLLNCRNWKKALDHLLASLPQEGFSFVLEKLALLDERTSLSDLIQKMDKMKTPLPLTLSQGRLITYVHLLDGERVVSPDQLIWDIGMPFVERFEAIQPVIGAFMQALYPALSYYVSLAKFGVTLQKGGLPYCFPDMHTQPGYAEVSDYYNPLLGLPTQVPSETYGQTLAFPEDITTHSYLPASENIHVVLGRNNGSKTTYVSGRGVLQLMAQMGSPIPAQSATLNPVSCLGTVYVSQVDIGAGQSTFSRTLDELGTLFDLVSNNGTKGRTLALFDDYTEGTDPQKAEELMGRVLQLAGEHDVRAFMTSQQHRLAHRVGTRSYTTVPDSWEIVLLASDQQPERVSLAQIAQPTKFGKYIV